LTEISNFTNFYELRLYVPGQELNCLLKTKVSSTAVHLEFPYDVY